MTRTWPSGFSLGTGTALFNTVQSGHTMYHLTQFRIRFFLLSWMSLWAHKQQSWRLHRRNARLGGPSRLLSPHFELFEIITRKLSQWTPMHIRDATCPCLSRPVFPRNAIPAAWPGQCSIMFDPNPVNSSKIKWQVQWFFVCRFQRQIRVDTSPKLRPGLRILNSR